MGGSERHGLNHATRRWLASMTHRGLFLLARIAQEGELGVHCADLTTGDLEIDFKRSCDLVAFERAGLVELRDKRVLPTNRGLRVVAGLTSRKHSAHHQ